MDGLFCDDHVTKGWWKRGCGLAGYFHMAHKTVFYFLLKIFLMNVIRSLAKMEDLVKTYLVITDVIAHQVLPEGNAI